MIVSGILFLNTRSSLGVALGSGLKSILAALDAGDGREYFEGGFFADAGVLGELDSIARLLWQRGWTMSQ